MVAEFGREGLGFECAAALALRSLRRLAPALAILAAICFLGGTALGQEGAGDEAGAPEVVQFRAEISDVNALIAWVTVSLSDEARVQIEYWNEGAGRFRAPLSEPAVNHYLPVVRLRAGTTYEYSIGVEGPEGEIAFRAGDGGEFTTRELPEALGRYSHRVEGRSTQQLILGDFMLHLVFWDDDGQIVWYYSVPEGTQGIGAIKRTADGNLRWEAWRCCLREVSPTAEQVGEIIYDIEQEQSSPHHDYWVLDDGRILSITEENVEVADPANAEGDPITVVTDVLLAWDPVSGSSERVWEAVDAWEIELPDMDSWEWQVAWGESQFRWTHANSMQIRPRGNVILSLRSQRKIVSLSPDLQTVEWELGGIGSDFSFPEPSDQFYAQHAATELPNGNILMFDNGNLRPEAEGGNYSRALELRLDKDAGTAVKAWEHRTDPDLFVSRFGSAYRLRNGNTLVNYGITLQATETEWLEQTPIVLVEADETGGEVFRMETWDFNAPSRYRTYGDIDSIMGEVRLPSLERPQPGTACMGDEDDLCVQTIPQPPADPGAVALERSFRRDGALFRLPAGRAVHKLNLGSQPLDDAGRTAEPMRLCLPEAGSGPVAMLARYSAEDGQWELLQGAKSATGDSEGGVCGLTDRSGRYAVVETEMLSAGLDGTRANSSAIWRAGSTTSAAELLGGLANSGVRALYWHDGAAWRGYAAPIDGEPVPGAEDFEIRPGAMLWLGG